jgi:hypothetical protein
MLVAASLVRQAIQGRAAAAQRNPAAWRAEISWLTSAPGPEVAFRQPAIRAGNGGVLFG